MGRLSESIESLRASLDNVKRALDDRESLDDDDINSLRDLFLLKVYHYSAFELLLKTGNSGIAYSLLVDDYLEPSVNLAEHSKDHVADLEMFFESIVSIKGEDALRDLFAEYVNEKQEMEEELYWAGDLNAESENEIARHLKKRFISKNHLLLPRVQAAVRFALDSEDQDLPEWYLSYIQE